MIKYITIMKVIMITSTSTQKTNVLEYDYILM